VKDNTFWVAIYGLRKSGLIPQQWTRNDLKSHLTDQFKLNTINTVPSNQSMTRDGSKKGNYIFRGSQAMAWRVGPGKYELINDPEDLLKVKRVRP